MKEEKRFVRPEDRARIDTTLRGVKRMGGAWHAEYRVVHRPNESCSAETRWVAFDGSVARRRGTAPSLFGTVRDITQRKRAEQELAERNLQLSLAGKAALVGSYAYDAKTEWMEVSEGLAAIHGLPEGTTKTTRVEWQSRVHPEDVGKMEDLQFIAYGQQRGEYGCAVDRVAQFRFLRWQWSARTSDRCQH